MSVVVKGADAFLKKLNNAPKKIRQKSAKALQDSGNKMVSYARSHHNFKTRTGNLERSITAKVDTPNLSLLFYINSAYVTTGGYNYGLIQHDGSRSGYKRSTLSPSFSSKGGSGGVQYDHFMVVASDKYSPLLTKELRSIVWRSLNGLS